MWLVLALLLVPATLAQAETVEPAKPLDRAPPAYPDSAGNALGHVKIQFTIDADGHVTDPQVLESAPPGLFDKAALDAMKSWRYAPRRVDGRAAAQPSNTIALNFVPAPPDPAHIAVMINNDTPAYPREAFDQKLEGDVTVGFDIDEIGLVKHPHVTQSTAKIFDDAAVTAIKNSRFRPPTVDGVPTAAHDLSLTIPFRLATAVLKPKRIDHATLTYPAKAQQAGQQGYCYMTVAVAGDGSVENVDIVATGPGDVFRQACTDFGNAARFEPPDADKTGHMSRKYSFTIVFKFDQSHPLLQPGQWAKIRYTLGTSGQMLRPEVIAVSEPEIYTPKIIEAVRGRKMKPVLENGVPVEKPGQILIVSGDDD